MTLTAESILTGAVARAMGARYEARPQQLAMASAVERAFDSASTLIAEAGTGTGKSFAYLVPAFLRAASGQTVVVATNTIALQEQLFDRDIPLLLRALEAATDDPSKELAGKIRPVLVKGRSNYLSIRRLRVASSRQQSIMRDDAQLRSLHQVEDWAYQTLDGTVSSLPQLERPEVWEHAVSDADNCLGRRCPHYNECFYQSARRKAGEANVLVCNHALFFSDLALRSRGVGFLPRYDHVVLDEAHMVEDVAGDHMGLSISEGRVAYMLRYLYNSGVHASRGRGPRQTGVLEANRLATNDNEKIDAAITLVLRASTIAEDYFDAWRTMLETGRLTSGRLREPAAIENTLSPALRDLARTLDALRAGTKNENAALDFSSQSRRALELADGLDALAQHSLADSVYWAEGVRARGGARGRGVRITLACAPIDVGPVLRDALFTKGLGIVLTSATLSTKANSASGPERAKRAGDVLETDEGQPVKRVPIGEGFAHTTQRLGCDGAATLQVGSPFNFARQARIYVDTSLPPPNSPQYTSRVALRVIEHARETDGGTLVLCTSLAFLDELTRAIEPALGEHHIKVLAQERDGARSTILEEFRRSGRAVLLGAASFWQGVDIPGHALRSVIITRLPFDPPDRPLTAARLERVSEHGGDPFKDESLPRAIIRFKQGFGRLIRTAEDVGRVVVLDPRIVTTWYGRFFLRALPPGIPLADQATENTPGGFARTDPDQI